MKFSLGTFILPLLLAAAPAAAQNGEETDYQKMMEKMMQSGGNYSQAQSQAWDARLKVVSGTVRVRTAEKEEWYKITGEIPLDSNDTIKTASDAVAELYLDDKAAISIGRNTEVELSSLQQEHTLLSINVGSLAAKVKRLLDSKHKFEVRTPSAVCAIRGTEFAVEYSQLGKESLAAVFDEGRLAVSQAEGDGGAPQEFVLEKNTEIVFNPSQKRFRPVAVSRMGRHRSSLLKMRKRLDELKSWRPRSASRRAALRERSLKGKIIRKQLKSRSKPSKGVRSRKAPRTRAGTGE